jgi:photosystem II stability/assembly factor-like uncharacterized protein
MWAPAALVLALGAVDLLAQGSSRDFQEDKANLTVPPEMIEGLKYRSLNFSRGGRSTAVTGVPGQPLVYYMGSTGGGVWKTTDAGNNWTNVSDGHFGVGSVGAIAVAASDPNVVYVGTGSACPRGNISVGDGIYKSTDAGRTWKHVGLRNAGQIGKVRVHPADPERVYVAALGTVFGPNEDRGIYRSKDGGQSWEKVLFVSDRTGFVDVAMDPSNPRILYAGAWRAERKPWTLISGSEDRGIWKSSDGGHTWAKLAGGLPAGLVGKTSIAISPANPNRVWVLIEAEGERGGVYRTEDAGKSWQRVNGDNILRQRAWYYTHIFADPKDENTVYGLNVNFHKSIDGGRTFATRINVPHGDNHDLWINPDNPLNLIGADDGGAHVSFDGGKSWSWQMNQPTAEIYRVFVDNQWPYRVYGSQQDNSTISVPSRGMVSFNFMPPEWYQVGGCESGHIAIDPRDPDIVYATCYGGQLSRVNRKTGEYRQILNYPQLQLGQAARDLKYRFQWNAPVRLSPHNPDVIYHLSQIVHRSEDGGQSWADISPDLTTNSAETQDYAGGPITRDGTGVEVFNTIFAFEESPHQAGLLWAGTDDGKVQLSRDGGKTWKDVTPARMPARGTVNMIELSAHSPGRAFIVVYRYRENDFKPYIFRTNDYGGSWDLLTDGKNGIPPTHFVRVAREDPDRKGLLYAGSEFGMYVSFDEGAHWQRLQNNLPVTPVTDLRVQRKDLVVSTQGRAFWVLDDLSPLHQLNDAVKKASAWLYAPRAAYRSGGGAPLGGASLYYYFAKAPEGEVKLEILDGTGKVVRTVTGKAGDEPAAVPTNFFEAMFGAGGQDKLPVKAGLNSFNWNLRGEAPKKPEGVVHWGATPGMEVVPGTYQVKLTAGDWSQTQSMQVQINPNLKTTVADFEKQRELGQQIASKLDSLYHGLTRLRDAKTQAGQIVERMKKAGLETKDVADAAKALTDKLTAIEEKMTQVKSKSEQDPINFPPMVDNQLSALYLYVVAFPYQPTAGAYRRFEDLKPEIDDLLRQLDQVMSGELSAFNELVRGKNLAPVLVGKSPTS